MDIIGHLLFARQAPPRGDPATTPVLAPPPGVKSNFVDPYSRGPMLVQLNAILLTLVMLFFMMRMWTRVFITRSLGWDDCEFQRSDVRLALDTF